MMGIGYLIQNIYYKLVILNYNDRSFWKLGHRFGFQHLHWILSKKVPQWLIPTGRLNISFHPLQLMLTSPLGEAEGEEKTVQKQTQCKSSAATPKAAQVQVFKLQIFL